MRQRKESLFSMVIKLYFNLKVWAGPLSLGRTVVLLWNRSDMGGTITAEWGDIGLQSGTAVTIYDIWKKETVNQTGIDLLSSEVSPHSVAMFILTPANVSLDSGTSEYMR
jgi:hypothetical protein